jgi:putative aldouronate transport system permease protein
MRRKTIKLAHFSTQLENYIFNFFNTLFMLLLAIITLYPFLNTIAISLNEGLDTIRGGIYVFPRAFTLNNYRAVLSNLTIYNAFLISVARALLSTVLNVFLTTMLAYALSRKNYIFRQPITIVFVLTMYFHAGLIPIYFLYRNLGLLNNFLVYILPSLVGAFNFIVIRTYINTMSDSLVESAKMDGAGDFRIFLQIIFPLCKPVLATVALFVAVGAWNSWFDSFIFCSSKQYLSTLQYELMKLIAIANTGQSNSAMLANAMAGGGNAAQSFMTPLSIRAAVTIITAVPIILVYPFLQKYFIKGLMIGSVKE